MGALWLTLAPPYDFSATYSIPATKPSRTASLQHLSNARLQNAAFIGSKQLETWPDPFGLSHPTQLTSEVTADELIELSLGLSGRAELLRRGNSVLVDPDDHLLCNNTFIQGRVLSVNTPMCLIIMRSVSVRIDATTAAAGSISYLFNAQPVFSISYSSNEASYRLYLDGVNRVLHRIRAVSEQSQYE